MRRYIPLAIFVVIIALGGFLIYRQHKPATSGFATIPISTATSSPELAAQRDAAWQIFESYRSALANHDTVALATSSYRVSSACSDQSRKRECDDLMDTLYGFVKDLKESDLPYITGDERQIILMTDYHKHLDGDAPSVTRGVITFARKANGRLGVLAVEPFQGVIIARNTDATSTIEARLNALTKDTDGDGLPDAVETCSGGIAETQCTRTDPYKIDTDGNGWWDSVEQYIKS